MPRTPLPAVLCVKTGALLDRAARLAGLVHEGAWLGLLTAAERVAVTDAFFSVSNMYRSSEHNTAVLYDWERKTIEKYYRPFSSVLVAAAGAGREVLVLRRMGFQAQGFDCCASLVDASREMFAGEPPGPPILLARPNEVPAGLPNFGGIIVGWGGYHHIPGRGRRIHFLRELRRLTPAGAPLLLSFFVRHDAERRYNTCLVRVARVFRVLSCFRGEPVAVGDRLMAGTQCHSFTQDEVRDELSAAGFRLDYFSDEEYGHAVGIAE